MFVCRYRAHNFELITFRLVNAPMTFQRMTNEIISDFKLTMVYVNYVLIYSKTVNGHLDHLKRVSGGSKSLD